MNIEKELNYRRSGTPCPKCGSCRTTLDVSCVLTSYPSQYRYECMDCNHIWTGFGEAKIGPITSWPDLEQGVSVEPLNYGWICPKCGRVYSPSTSQCFHCGGGLSPNVVYCGTNSAFPTKDVMDSVSICSNPTVSVSTNEIINKAAEEAMRTVSQIKSVK